MLMDLGNGNIIEVEIKGNYYYTEGKISESMFEGMGTVLYDGVEIKNHKLNTFSKSGKGYKFSFIQKTKEELKKEANQRYGVKHNQYIKETFDRVSVALPKGTKEKITSMGFTVNGFINEAVRVMLEAQEDT